MRRRPGRYEVIWLLAKRNLQQGLKTPEEWMALVLAYVQAPSPSLVEVAEKVATRQWQRHLDDRTMMMYLSMIVVLGVGLVVMLPTWAALLTFALSLIVWVLLRAL
jgi:hypothetical protein